MHELIFRATGEKVTEPTFIRELKRLGLTRKKIQRVSILRRESERVNYWTNGPLDVACA
jgi:hypothetical protein